MAKRMSVFVITEVGRARHVAMVRGLKRKLDVAHQYDLLTLSMYGTNLAAMPAAVYLTCFRGESNNLKDDATPVSAILMSAYALNRSSIMYIMLVANGNDRASGRREKSGRSNGAWWKTPPSYGDTLCV